MIFGLYVNLWIKFLLPGYFIKILHEVKQLCHPKSIIKIVEILIISSLIRIVFNIKVQAKLLHSLIGKGFY